MADYSTSTHTDDNYAQKLEELAQKHGSGKYCRTLFIGLGGSGQKSLLHLRYLLLERFGVEKLPGMAFLAIDTDTSDVLADQASTIYKQRQQFSETEIIHLKAEIKTILDNLQDHKHIEEWLDPALDVGKDFAIADGAGQMRPVSRIAMFTQMDEIASRIQAQLDSIKTVNEQSDRLLPDGLEVYVVAGLAGGTGSGTFLDIPALVKTINNEAQVIGFLVLPDCFKDVGKYEKSSANGAAALRELNHFLTNPFHAQWTNSLRTVPEGAKGLFNQVYLHGGTNMQGLTIDKNNKHLPYHNIGEALFLRYSTGSMPGFIKSVRINRVPYMRQQVKLPYDVVDPTSQLSKQVDALSWKTFLSTFGVAKLVYPSWRWFHYARFDLAAKIVNFYNPTANDGIQATVGIWRDRFMIKWGAFQGTHKETEEEYKDFAVGDAFLVRDALLKLPGDGADNILDAVTKMSSELSKRAEVMFEEKKTTQGIESIESKLRSKFGSPELETGMGDWTAQIRKNKQSFIKHLKNTLNDVIEYFYSKQGLAVVQTVLEQIIEVLEKDVNTDAKYIAFMENEAIKQSNNTPKCLDELNKSKKVAIPIDTQFFPPRSLKVYKDAIDEVEADLRQYWSARYKAFVAQEGAEVLKKVKEMIKDKVQTIKAVTDAMEKLSKQLQADRDFFKNPKTSNNIIELPAQTNLDNLLQSFLGKEDPQKRLKHYIKNTIEPKLGLDTYVGLETKMLDPNSVTVLKSQLELILYSDIQGSHGYTKAFATKEELANEDYKGVPGFLQEYSIERGMLEGGLLSQVKSQLEDVIRNTKPWVKKTTHQGAIQMNPENDIFVCLPQATKAPGAEGKWEELKKHIRDVGTQNGMRISNFIPSQEPSEIIFYSEQTAFPIFYHQEISRLQPNSFLKFYEQLQNDKNNPTVLHLFRDYHSFTPLEPFHPQDQEKREQVYKSLLKAQMLGIIQTVPQRASAKSLPNHRIGYIRYEPGVGSQNTSTYLHEDHLLIYFLQNTPHFNRLNMQIEEYEKRLVENNGSYAHLYALADYWYHIIHPMHRDDTTGGLNQGSVHSKVMMTIRAEYMNKTLESSDSRYDKSITTSSQLYNRTQGLINTLRDWTIPNAQKETYPLIMRKPLQPSLQCVKWDYGSGDLTDLVTENSEYYFRTKWMDPFHQNAGEKPLPALQINWKKFAAKRYNCTVPLDGTPYDLFAQTANDIIQQLKTFLSNKEMTIEEAGKLEVHLLDENKKPSGSPLNITDESLPDSKVFIDGLTALGWKPQDPSVAVSNTNTGSFTPPTTITGPLFSIYYATPSVAPVKLSVDEIVGKIQSNPQDQHMLSTDNGQSWKLWKEVPDVANKVVVSKEYYYATPSVAPVKLSADDIIGKIQSNPQDQHMLSTDNGQSWKLWKEVPDVASKVVLVSNPFGNSGPTNPFGNSGPTNPFGNSGPTNPFAK